jgi:hypothetical protein
MSMCSLIASGRSTQYRQDQMLKFPDLGEERLDSGLILKVQLLAADVVAAAEAPDRVFQLGGVGGRDEHGRAFGERGLGGGEAQPGRAADDDDRFACERCHL